jgi:hypothetical protein
VKRLNVHVCANDREELADALTSIAVQVRVAGTRGSGTAHTPEGFLRHEHHWDLKEAE